jgi:uncharacterized protein YegL
MRRSVARKLLSVAVATLLAFPAVLGGRAPAALAIGPQCTDSNLPNRLDPAPYNGHPGRITVLFDANQITDPTQPDAQARGTAIAREVQKRAEGALDRYDQLGFAIPAAATLKILCAPVLDVTDRDAITPVPGNVQFRSSYIRQQFRDAVFNGTDFNPGPWNSKCRNWWTTVDHESFHLVQGETWGLIGAAWKFLWRWEFTRFESTATLAQDLFSDVDDLTYTSCADPGAAQAGTYLGATNGFLGALPTTDTADNKSAAAYQVAPVYQYWAERYGDAQELNLENRAGGMLDRILRADDDHERALTNALGADAFDAYREFLIAALIRKQPGVISPRQFQDELVGFGGSGPGQPYDDVLIRTRAEPVAPATPYSDLNQVLEKYGGRVYRLNLDPAITRAKVELRTTSTGGLGPLFQTWSRPRIALLPIASDGTVAVELQYFLTGADMGQTQTLTMPVAGRSELGLILVSTPDAFAYDLTVTDASGTADLVIQAPTTQAPRPIGAANDLQRLDVVVRPTVDGVFEPGVPRSAFTVSIGGQPADVLAARQDADSYTLRVQPNGPLADGTHDLAVTFGGVTKTQPGAVIVGVRPGAAVALVIDRSGSMLGSRITAAKAAAVDFVRKMQIGDQIALVTFNSTATVDQPLVTLSSEAVRDQVIQRINAIVASGGTNIAAGLQAGNNQLVGATTGFGRAIVLLSDGIDSSDIDSVIATIPPDVDVHTIALDSGSDQARLQHIAEATGGTFLFAPDSTALADLYARIRALITGTEVSASGSFGTIAQGAEADATATVAAGAATATFNVNWTGSDFALSLTSPTGRVITETSTDTDVTVTQGSNFVTIAVSTPEAGAWHLHILGVDVPVPEPVAYRVEEAGADIRSSIDVGGSTAGMPITARVDLTEPAGPLADATVVAEVEDPGAVSRTFRLFDDGGHADGFAADGVYGAELWATDLSGSYTVRVTATGTDASGKAFVREEAASVFLGSKVDTDGDGVADGAELRYATPTIPLMGMPTSTSTVSASAKNFWPAATRSWPTATVAASLMVQKLRRGAIRGIRLTTTTRCRHSWA